MRGGKFVPLKTNNDAGVEECPTVQKVIVVKSGGDGMTWKPERDIWWHDEMVRRIRNYCEPEQMDAEDPLFILYTSGSTGKPKGVLHTTGGYMLYTNLTFRYISIIMKRISISAPQTSAGSPAIATLCTGRFPTAQQALCSKVFRRIPTQAGSGAS